MAARSSSVWASSLKGVSFRQSVGQTSAQPPQRTQRAESKTGVTPQSRHREASRMAKSKV